MITAVDCTIVRFDPKQVVPAFFNYYSQSHDYLSAVDSETTGTTRKRISRSKLGLMPIPVPPLPEQQRIVGILDEASEGIATAKANAEKNLQNARGLFESHLQSVFSQRGKGWVEKTLGETCENLDSNRVPITRNKRIAGEYPYYGASGVVDHVSDYIFDEDLLLVSEDGANLLARTYPIAFSVSGKVWVNNHAHVLRFADLVTQRFMEFYLNSIKLDSYVSGMAQPKLNQKSLNSIPVPAPPLRRQKTVVQKLDALSKETQRLESLYRQKLAALDALKKSLLHQAFNGKL
jgi:type I restriction enzyme S subunit